MTPNTMYAKFFPCCKCKGRIKVVAFTYSLLNMNNLKFLGDKGMVLVLLKNSSLDLCKGCIYGKQTRKSFPVGKPWRDLNVWN